MRRLTLAFLALVVALACSVGSAVAAPRPLNTGISYVPGSDAVTIGKVKETGSTFIQTPLRWNFIAPKERPASWNPEDPGDPNYDWGSTDEFVENAVRAGLTPVLQVRSAPRWADRCEPTGAFDAVCNPDPAALAAFTKAAVRRYSGSYAGLPQVRYWQALNEPNLSLFFQPQFEGADEVSEALYRNLLNSFYVAVKSVEPADLVIAAGLGPIAVPKYTIGPMKFARKLLCMSGGSKPKPVGNECEGGVSFDIFDIHPYTTGRPTHKGGPNDVEMGDLGKLQNLLAAADKAHRINSVFKRTPLWITEFSYDSKPPDPGGLAMKIESQWVAEALHEAWSAGVSNFFWYSLSDNPLEPGETWAESLQSGLYFYAAQPSELQPKEALSAYRFPFTAIRSGKVLGYWGRTPTGRGGGVVVEAFLKGRWQKMRSAKADSAGIFKGTIRTSYGTSRKGAVRARYRNQYSLGFPMRRAGDFPQPPFG